MTEHINKVKQQRQQKINEAFKRQRLDLPIDDLVAGAIRDTDTLIDDITLHTYAEDPKVLAEAKKKLEQTADGSPYKAEYDKLYPVFEDDGWNVIGEVGESTVLAKGDKRKVVSPDKEDFDFTVPKVIYQAPKNMDKKSPEELKKSWEKRKKPRERPKKQPKHIPSQRPGGKK